MKKIMIVGILALLLLAACQPTNQLPQNSKSVKLDSNVKVEIIHVPEGPLLSGESYVFKWFVSGGKNVKHTNIHSSFSEDFSDKTDSEIQSGTPGPFTGILEITSETENDVYIRAHAEVDGELYYSKVVEIEVEPLSDVNEEKEEYYEGYSEKYNDVGDETSLSGDLKEINNDNARVQEFEIIAKQFEFVPSTITVKKDVPVRLIIESPDVPHSIELPMFGLDDEINPGEPAIVEFTPDRVGEFPFWCDVYCGKGHKDMKGLLVVAE